MPREEPTLSDATARAMELLARNGYESTTVNELAVATGMSRSTFFRRWGSKEDIVFADHDLLLERVEIELREHAGDPLDAVADGARLVLRHHLNRPEISRFRHQLLQQNAALRDRELVTSSRYERAFTLHLRETMPQQADNEWMIIAFAAAIVSVHNLTLRSWLKGSEAEPAAALEHRSHALVQSFRALLRPADTSPATRRLLYVGVVEPGASAADLLADIATELDKEV